MPDIFAIVHLGFYVLGLIPSIIVATSIDYTKFIKAKSNINYYLCAMVIAVSLSFLLGEFLYNLITLFIK